MSLVNTLMSGSGLVPTHESFMSCDDMYTGTIRDDYLESYLVDRLYESTVTELMAAQEANLVVDIMGEIKVMTEGADPQVLMEGVLANIGEAIKKFFAKIAQFFKDLFATITGKAKKAKESDEAKKLADEMNNLRDEIRGMKASQNLESMTFEMYEYPANMMETGNKICEGVINKYKTAIEGYKSALDKIITGVNMINTNYEKNYNKNGYDAGRNYDDLKFTGSSGKKGHDVDALVRYHQKASNTADRWERSGDKTIEKEIKDGNRYGIGGDSGESRAKSGYGSASDEYKLDYDNNIAKLKMQYEKSKLPTDIGAGAITKEEADMGRNEYIKYVMRGKKTGKSNLSYNDAAKVVCDLAGSSTKPETMLDPNGTFYAFCIGDEKSSLYKMQLKVVNTAKASVDAIKREIDKMLEKADKAIKKDAQGYDKIKSAVDSISGFITNHVSDVTTIASIPSQVLTEAQACGRAVLRATIADVKRKNSADYDKKREKMSDWEKEQEEKATRESTGLFEQAYSLGLF